jgi:pentatricopeptide repeat protein
MLNKHSQVLQFLEMLQLMDSCVRSGQYEDALRLLDYVRSLDRKQGQQVPLIRTIAVEAEQYKQVIVQHLLRELYVDISVQDVRKVIGHLRKLQTFDETKLRIKFLIVSCASKLL